MALKNPDAAPPGYVRPTIQNQLWYEEQGACFRTDEDFMVDAPRGRPGPPETRLPTEQDRLIATFCMRCAGREDCLAESLVQGDEYGIRGGLTKEERRPLLTAFRRKGAKHGLVPEELWNSTHQFPANYTADDVQRYFGVRSRAVQPIPARNTTSSRSKNRSTETYKSQSRDSSKPTTVPAKAATAEVDNTPEQTIPEATSITIESLKSRVMARRVKLQLLSGLPKSDTKTLREELQAEIDELKGRIQELGQAS